MSPDRRLANWLLVLYPRSFRERFGSDFVRDFAADWAEIPARGGRIARAAVRIRMVVSAAALALLEWSSSAASRLRIRAHDGGSNGGFAAGFALDFRSAARGFWRSPGFTLLAVVTLGAGIGINTTAFAVIDAVLLRDLPYPEPDRIVGVRITGADGTRLPGLSFREYERLQARDDLFTAVGGIRPNYAEVLPMDLDVIGVDRPEKLQGIEVSPELFTILGIEPALGRVLAPEDRDGHDGAALNYMVSYEYWRRALGSDPEIIGKSLTIEYRAKTIVGVLPPDTRLLFDPQGGVPERADLWTRIYHLVDDRADSHYLRALGRLRDDVELEQAQVAVTAMAAAWRDELPEVYGDGPARVELIPLKTNLTAASRPLLGALTAAVVLVLLIACANAASLVLARFRARERELAVRRAMGASAARLRRLIFTESLLLAGLGSGLGLILSALSMRGVELLAGEVLPRADVLRVEPTTVVFAVGLALASGLLAATLAVLQRRGEAAAQLRQGARLAGSRQANRYRGLLTIVQTAVAVVLLIGAGLMLRTLINLAGVDLGFQPDGVLTFKVEIDETQIALGPPRYEFFRDVAAAAAREPEFEAMSAIFVLPTHGGFDIDRYGRTTEELESNDFMASFNIVLPGYFQAMRIPLIAGEDFRPEWPAGDLGEIIIDRRIAERLWPGQEAVGRTLIVDFDMQNPDVRDRVEARIVGVAEHTHQDGVRGASVPQIYTPHWHRPFWGMNFVGRLRDSATSPAAIATATRAVQRVVDADPDAVYMHSARPLSEVVAEASHDGRLLSRVLAVFSGLALLLSATGLYGVISYATRQRTREIGIRMATGAQQRDVALLIVRGALRLSGSGVTLGMLAAFAMSRLLESMLFGVASADPLTYVMAGGVLFAVGMIAAVAPAVRAATVDPVRALRTD